MEMGEGITVISTKDRSLQKEKALPYSQITQNTKVTGKKDKCTAMANSSGTTVLPSKASTNTVVNMAREPSPSFLKNTTKESGFMASSTEKELYTTSKGKSFKKGFGKKGCL